MGAHNPAVDNTAVDNPTVKKDNTADPNLKKNKQIRTSDNQNFKKQTKASSLVL